MKYDFMIRNKYAWLVVMAFVSISTFAQKAERDYIRKGNRAFKDSIYVDAEVDYRKALDANPKSTIAHFNLGNTLLWQNKAQEAMNEFVDAARIEKDKGRKAQIFHNIGVIFHSTKEYAKAIEAYKESLRNNPNDDETRYNLALAQKMLKDQQQNQQDQDQNQQDEQKKQQEQQQNQDQQQNQQQQDQQQVPPEQKQDEMSKENAEQLLNSVMQDEQNTQDKVKKQQQAVQGTRLEKDW